MGKLSLEVLRKEQQCDQFCKCKVRDIKKTQPQLPIGPQSILRKVTELKYTLEPAIVVPRKLTSLIIIEFHNAKGHQGISQMLNMIRCYFWWDGMQRNVHQHINTCQLCIQFLPSWMYIQPLHLEISQVLFAGCVMDCIGPLPATLKRLQTCTNFICLLTSYLITVPLRTKMADEVSMVYMKKILPKTSCP